MAEVHDCFTPAELLIYEDLQFAERGTAWKEVLDGTFDLEGALPGQPRRRPEELRPPGRRVGPAHGVRGVAAAAGRGAAGAHDRARRPRPRAHPQPRRLPRRDGVVRLDRRQRARLTRRRHDPGVSPLGHDAPVAESSRGGSRHPPRAGCHRGSGRARARATGPAPIGSSLDDAALRDPGRGARRAAPALVAAHPGRRRAAVLGRRAARARDRAGAAAVRALAPLRVHARAPLLPRPRQQLRRPRRPHGVGPDASRRNGSARLASDVADVHARRRHARVVRRRPARRRHRRCPTATCSSTATTSSSGCSPPTAPVTTARRARRRPARGRRARHRRGARHRARGLGQDPRAHRALPPARRPRLEPGLDHRGRVQRARQGHDAGRAWPTCPTARGAGCARCTRSATTSCGARAASSRAHRRMGDAAAHRGARAGEAARQHRHVRAVPRSAERGAARARRPERGRGPARRRRRLRRDVRRVPRQAARRPRDRPRRADLRRDRGAAARARRPRASSNARRATCSSTSSRTSRPRSSCCCASSPRPRTTSSASATTTR